MMWTDSPGWITDPKIITLITVSLLGIGSCIATLEWLANRSQWGPGGLLSFDVLSSRPPYVGPHLTALVLRRVLSAPSFLAILYCRLGALLILPVLVARGHKGATLIALGVIVVTNALIHMRSPFGLDGSDHMTTQIYGALFVCLLVGGATFITWALWYIAAQSAFAYLTSGVAKVMSHQWRRGEATYRVFNTRTYGFEPVARVLRNHRRLARLLDWAAIAAETAFPLGLLVGFPFVLVFIFWGALFHFANAVIMGLNSFFWAFVATYPALLYAAAMLQIHVFHR